MKIGFIGLGHMGHPMVVNLLKAGHQVYALDINPKALAEVVALGAIASASIAELMQHAEIVFTMVQTGEQVKKICLGPQGTFAHAKKGLLYIDCSSIDVTTTQVLHQEAKKLGIAMLDAPVSGGVAGAAAGTLTIMVGGTEADFARALPVLQLLGKKIVHAGSDGHGQAAKICNNLLLGISMVGVSEAFLLAEKLGLDPKKFFEISSNASGQCWAMTSYCPVPGVLANVPSSHDYEPGFMANMMLKDLHLGEHAADAVDAAIPMGEVAIKLYQHYVEAGFGEKDFSGIIRLLAQEKKGGTK